MKEKIKELIRSVPIADKTYSEYVEELAEKLLSQRICVLPKGTTSATWELMNSSDTKYMAYSDGRIEPIPSKTEDAREIFEEIEEGIKAAVSALQFENNPIHRQVKHETYSSLMRFIKSIEEKHTEE